MALRREFGVEMAEVRSALEVWSVCRDLGIASGAQLKEKLQEAESVGKLQSEAESVGQRQAVAAGSIPVAGIASASAAYGASVSEAGRGATAREEEAQTRSAGMASEMTAEAATGFASGAALLGAGAGGIVLGATAGGVAAVGAVDSSPAPSAPVASSLGFERVQELQVRGVEEGAEGGHQRGEGGVIKGPLLLPPSLQLTPPSTHRSVCLRHAGGGGARQAGDRGAVNGRAAAPSLPHLSCLPPCCSPCAGGGGAGQAGAGQAVQRAGRTEDAQRQARRKGGQAIGAGGTETEMEFPR